jgi:hypothetical protein
VHALPFPKDRAQRLLTDASFLRDPAARIYAIGDCATRAGDALPATAQVAQQEGDYLGPNCSTTLARGRTPRVFKYRNMGMLAYIGGHRALADLPKFKGKGFTTWLFWRSAYSPSWSASRTRSWSVRLVQDPGLRPRYQPILKRAKEGEEGADGVGCRGSPVRPDTRHLPRPRFPCYRPAPCRTPASASPASPSPSSAA